MQNSNHNFVIIPLFIISLVVVLVITNFRFLITNEQIIGYFILLPIAVAATIGFGCIGILKNLKIFRYIYDELLDGVKKIIKPEKKT